MRAESFSQPRDTPSASRNDEPAAPRAPGLFVLIAMSALGPVALNIFIPSMPGLQAAFATDYGTAQLTLTLYLASLAVSQLFVGSISDRFGRRPVLLAGTALFIVASLASAFATSIELLILGRVLQAAGGCAGIALSRAVIRDLYPRDKAASLIGYVTMAMVVAPMVSPAIGGLLDQIAGWRTGFFVVALLGIVVLALAFRQLHETHHQRDRNANVLRLARNSLVLLREPAFMGYALCSSFGSGIFFAFLAGAPFIVTEIMGGTPADYGFYFIIISIGYMGGNFVSGRYATRAGANALIASGSLVALTGLALLVATSVAEIASPLAIFAPMAVIAISNGLTIPSATAAAISVRPQIAGAAAGVTGFLQIGTGAVATLAVGLAHDGSRWPMVAVMVTSGLIALAFLGLAIWASRRSA